MKLYDIFINFIYNLKKGIKNNKPILSTIKYWPSFFYYNYKNKSTIDMELPWLTLGAIEFLNRYIKENNTILEFGSGGSTLYFSSKAKEVVSIEHDKEWYKCVYDLLSKKNIKNVDLILVEGSEINDTTKDIYKSNYGGKFRYLNFFNYVHKIDKYEDQYFDLILIDGRARGDALKVSLPKLKLDGILVFDNADRILYKEYIHNYLLGFKKIIFYGPTFCDLGFSETHIYVNKNN